MAIILTDIIKKDRHDRDVYRVGRTAFSIRKDGDHFHVEDARKWDPRVATCKTWDEVLNTIEELLAK